MTSSLGRGEMMRLNKAREGGRETAIDASYGQDKSR